MFSVTIHFGLQKMKKYETRQMILAALATIIFCTIPNWSFAQATSVRGEDLAKLVDKVGPKTIEFFRKDGFIEVRPSTLPSDQSFPRIRANIKRLLSI